MNIEEILKSETCFECPKCAFRSYDPDSLYCSRCGTKLDVEGRHLVSIREYAFALLWEFLTSHVEDALGKCLDDIPFYATEYINANGSILHSTKAATQVLSVNWGEVEEAFEDYRNSIGEQYQWDHIEQLHAFCVIQHAQMLWTKIDLPTSGPVLKSEDIGGILEQLEAVLET